MITSDAEAKRQRYEGFEIISDNLDTTLTREQLKKAVDIIWDLIMVMSKDERDSKYLFGKGLLELNRNYTKIKEDPTKELSVDQLQKMKDKVERIKPLMDFVIKMRDVL